MITKPSPDFPLFTHNNGKWAKKIDGMMKSFGRWEDPAGAEAEYKAFLETNSPSTISVLTGSSDQEKIPRQPHSAKPLKRHPDFPLYPHSTGQWACRIHGEVRF
jgi:hypothetical protein